MKSVDINYVMGEYGCSEDTARKAMLGFENFLKWFENSKMNVLYTEVQLASNKHKFGGCNDLVFETDIGLAMGDIKTSNAIYPEHLCQVAAYAILWEENYPDMPITGGFHLCRFSKDHGDFSHHYWSNLDEAKELFLLYRRAYDLDKQLQKRVK